MEKRKAFRDGGAAAVDVDKGLLMVVRDDEKGTITPTNAADKFAKFLDLTGHNFSTFAFWFDGCGPKYDKGEYPAYYTAAQLKKWTKGQLISIVEVWVSNRKTGRKFPAMKWKITSPEKATEKSEKADTRIYI